MLNVKYIIKQDPDNPIGVSRNPNNFGNAWFINNIINAEDSETELLSLDKIDLKVNSISQNDYLKDKSYMIQNYSSLCLRASGICWRNKCRAAAHVTTIATIYDEIAQSPSSIALAFRSLSIKL